MLPRLHCVAWSPGGESLAAVGEDRFVRVFRVRDGGEVARIEHGKSIVTEDSL